MKKLVLLFIVVSFSLKTKAQVVFCPPGAEWHYLFVATIFWPGNIGNETIKYIGDSIEGSDNLKVLSHRRSSLRCSSPTRITLIKQKGDTVFFKNDITQNSWQILYNFACLPGQSWQTNVLTNTNQWKVFTFTVEAVNSITENGFNLKSLSVKTTSIGWSYNITERFGAHMFLFNYLMNANGCDGNIFQEFLCYQDNSFGVKQFGEKSCDYRVSNSVGLSEEKSENNMIQTFPNPVSAILHVEVNGSNSKELELIVSDLQGRELKRIIINEKDKIDLSNLSSGLYLISVARNKKNIYKEKLIKE